MEGLYFYKLTSPYKEDVTKDCKLTVNEIDHNFITLKNADIKDIYVDNNTSSIVIVRNDGVKFSADISHFTQDVKVEFDKRNGTIKIYHDSVIDTIDGLVTSENVQTYTSANVVVDNTLTGSGNASNPLGLVNTEKTSSYKAVLRVINRIEGNKLPNSEHVHKGDRFLTYEYLNEFGYLYNMKSAQQFVKDIHSDWRIPTKDDWDNMLNAIEVCNEDKNHQATGCNIVLGKVAGKQLKSHKVWKHCGANMNCTDEMMSNGCRCGCQDNDIFDVGEQEDTTIPNCKPINPEGIDAYGMCILPAGYGDGRFMLDYFGSRARFWTSSVTHISDVYVKQFDCQYAGVGQMAISPMSIASVRLVKDYDGSNYRGVETIGGVTYKTVLMPAENTPYGYSIWMGNNLAARECQYDPKTPNMGSYDPGKRVFIINEWNGFDWDRRTLEEGDSLVIVNGPDGDHSEEYRLVDGKLRNIKKHIVDGITIEYDEDIKNLQDKDAELENAITDLTKSLTGLSTVVEDEIQRSTSVDEELAKGLSDESKARQEEDTRLAEADEQTNQRITDLENAEAEANKALDDKINAETERAMSAEQENASNLLKTQEDLTNEVDRATAAETRLSEALDNANNAINDEIIRSVKEDASHNKSIGELKSRTISLEQPLDAFKCQDGTLTIKTDGDNKIIIKLDSNYGEF